MGLGKDEDAYDITPRWGTHGRVSTEGVYDGVPASPTRCVRYGAGNCTVTVTARRNACPPSLVCSHASTLGQKEGGLAQAGTLYEVTCTCGPGPVGTYDAMAAYET
jgi:hypothetical protein